MIRKKRWRSKKKGRRWKRKITQISKERSSRIRSSRF